MSTTKPKKIHWGECDVCGDKGQLWPSKPRVFCCGGVRCRAVLFWDAERWSHQWEMAQSRMRVGTEVNDLDLYARQVARGRREAPRATMAPKPKAAARRTKAKSAKAQAKARETKML